MAANKPGEHPIRYYREMGQLGGRPRLGNKASVAVYQDAQLREHLSVRIGEDLCKRLGWRKGTRIEAALTANKRIINLRPKADGVPLMRKTGARSLLFSQIVTGIMKPMAAQLIEPLVFDDQLTLRLPTPEKPDQ